MKHNLKELDKITKEYFLCRSTADALMKRTIRFKKGFEKELQEKLDKISASAALHDRFWQGIRHQIKEILGDSE